MKSRERRYRLGSHAKYDLKVHLVWVLKYRKRVLTGPVVVHTRGLLRQDDGRFQIDPS